MRPKRDFCRRYSAALSDHLKEGPRASLEAALGLGRRAVVIELGTLDLAKIHETALSNLSETGETKEAKQQRFLRARPFFAEAILPIEQNHPSARKASARLENLSKTLLARVTALADSHENLKKGTGQRKLVEASVKKNDDHYQKLLEESSALQAHLQGLAHKILMAHENERRKISRELHDKVAQTLLGINVRLLALKVKVEANNDGLQKEIANTQHVVIQCVKKMRRFADELARLP